MLPGYKLTRSYTGLQTRIVYTIIGVAIGAIAMLPLVSVGQDRAPSRIWLTYTNNQIAVNWDHNNSNIAGYHVHVWTTRDEPEQDSGCRKHRKYRLVASNTNPDDPLRSDLLPATTRKWDSGGTIEFGDDWYCAFVDVWAKDQWLSQKESQWVTGNQVKTTNLPTTQPETTGFSDIGGNTHQPNIARLAEIGITRGCNSEGTKFCPDRAVTRAEMATFMIRLYDELNG